MLQPARTLGMARPPSLLGPTLLLPLLLPPWALTRADAPQVSMALYDDTGQQGRREISLTCDARSNPKPKSYDWSTTTGPLPPSAIPQGSRLLIQPTEEPINTTFICRVSNDLGTGQAAMTVLLPGSPQESSHSPSALRILHPISGIVFVAVGALVYFRCLRQSRRHRHSVTANGADSYAAVKSEDCTSDEPPTEGDREQRAPPGDTEAGRMRPRLDSVPSTELPQ